MYCINLRRSSSGIQNNRTSRRQSESYKRLGRQQLRSKSSSFGKVDVSGHMKRVCSPNSQINSNDLDDEERRLGEGARDENSEQISLPGKSRLRTKKESKIGKDFRKLQHKISRRRQRSNVNEDSMCGDSNVTDPDFMMKSESHQFHRCSPNSSSPKSVVGNNLCQTSPLSEEKLFSTSVTSDLRLRNELKKVYHMLDMERNKNLALQYKLKDAESEIEAKKNFHSSEQVAQEYCREIQTLGEKVTYYRDKFEREETKRFEIQEELEDIRDENKKYAEQIDLLVFQHIPSVSPTFKDIGPVDFDVEESTHAVGSYNIGNKLGEGHYGSVRICTDTKTHQNYAVKILQKSNVNRFKDLKQIATEVHVLKRYRHPNVIHLQEVIHATDNIYVVTELCFMDLHKYHNEIGLTMESAQQVILGALRPLCHLHSNGICHLDLKPENILLTKSLTSGEAMFKHVRLCDFGLVNMTRRADKNEDIIREGYACGTPGFYAPEMILNERFEGRTADMWSLGCIVLEITLGFTQEWIDSYNHVDEDPLQFKKGLESCLLEISIEQYPEFGPLIDLLHRCLSIDPRLRITSHNALNHPWFST